MEEYKIKGSCKNCSHCDSGLAERKEPRPYYKRSFDTKITDYLMDWLWNHMKDPIPSDEEILDIQKETGLQIKQI